MRNTGEMRNAQWLQLFSNSRILLLCLQYSCLPCHTLDDSR